MVENDLISRINNGTNCPNCGAPINSTKCLYCGTTFIDFACIKINEPFFLKIKNNDDKIIISKVKLDNVSSEIINQGCASYCDGIRVAGSLSRSINFHLDFHSVNESDTIARIIDS